jgi:hypothetical protein
LYSWQGLNQIGLHFGIGLSGVFEARRRVELQIKEDKNRKKDDKRTGVASKLFTNGRTDT